MYFDINEQNFIIPELKLLEVHFKYYTIVISKFKIMLKIHQRKVQIYDQQFYKLNLKIYSYIFKL